MAGASESASTRETATLRRAHRFELAARDMDEAAVAAAWMSSHAAPADVQRVLLTGIVMTYARPFTDSGVGMIDRGKYAPPDRDRSRLRDRLIDLRDRLYAHTDVTTLRWIAENVRTVFGMSVDVMGIQPDSAVEIVVEPDVTGELPNIAALAADQARQVPRRGGDGAGEHRRRTFERPPIHRRRHRATRRDRRAGRRDPR